MELNVKLEDVSPISRKLTITVPATEVSKRFEAGLVEVQKTANLKGFRPGNAPIGMIRQMYGEDVRHRIFHQVIDESFAFAARKHELKPVGRPKIDSSKHNHGEGEHDHGIKEGEDLTFTATVDVLPVIEVKNYTGVALKREVKDVTDADVEALVKNIQDSNAQLIPAGAGLVGADGSSTSRPAKKGDFVDISFDGGLVTDAGLDRKEGMKGSRMVEIGSDSLIPGFEENLIGMRSGETKTFQLKFPEDYFAEDFKGKTSEFTVTVSEVKEKKLPELDDEFAKGMGYADLKDLRTKARESMIAERKADTDRKLRSDLLGVLIEKTKFEVPLALIESQTRALAQDFAQELKQQQADDATIQQAVLSEIANLKARAENQVRASLILEEIANREKISVSAEDRAAEMSKMAASMRVEESRLMEFYEKNADRREDLDFRLRQEKVVAMLLDKAKISG